MNIGKWVDVGPFPGGPERVCLSSHPSQRSGMWRAIDEYDRVWLVRLFSPDVMETVGWRKLKKLGDLDHPNVVRVGGQLVFDGKPGIVREWVEGQSLDSFWGSHARIGEVERVFQSILHGVKAAHALGIVHGSLKPSRVYLNHTGPVVAGHSQAGQIQIVDFSLGPWLPPRPMDGPWLAPERRERFEFDERADIYALGAILYWLVTGTIPQRTPVPAQELRRDIPASLLRAISGAMEPDRDRRFPSCTILDELVGEIGSQDEVGGFSFPIGLEAAEPTGDSDDRTAEEVIKWQGALLPGNMLPHNMPAGKLPTMPPLSQLGRDAIHKNATHNHGSSAGASVVPPQAGLADLFKEEPEDLVAPSGPRAPLPPRTRDPVSQSTSGGVGRTVGMRDVLGVLLGGILLGVMFAVTYVLSRPEPAASVPEVVVTEHARVDTVPTIFEFAGTMPDEVVVQCPGSYQSAVSLLAGRAVITDMPKTNGCSMFVRGVSVDRPVAVRQGGVYHCVINRPTLICR